MYISSCSHEEANRGLFVWDKFFKTTTDILKETIACVATNVVTVTYHILIKDIIIEPNISTIELAGTVIFLNNKNC